MARKPQSVEIDQLKAKIQKLQGELNTSRRDTDSAIRLHAETVNEMNEDIRTALEILEDERRMAADLRREKRDLEARIEALKNDLARGHRALATQAEIIDEQRHSAVSDRLTTDLYGEEHRRLTPEWLREQRRGNSASARVHEKLHALREGQG